MPGFDNLGKVLLVFGLVIAGLGLVMILAGRLPFLGRLPGDVTIRGDNVSCFFPLATMIVLSLVLTLLLNLVVWFLRR